MIRLLLWILLLFAAVCFGLLIYTDPGYLLIAYRQWTVEMPLWLGIIIALISLILLSILFHVLQTMVTLPHYLREQYSKHHLANAALNKSLLLQKSTYIARQEWEQLSQVLPQLQKRRLMTKEENYYLTAAIHNDRFQRTNQNVTLQKLQEQWLRLPRWLRKNAMLVATYVKLLLQHNAYVQAEQLLHNQLSSQWNETLILLYGLIKTDNIESQLKYAEKYLKRHAQDPTLLLTLGRLCMEAQLWGKARTYLEKSITLKPRTETFLELARLHEKLSQPNMAMSCYRDGLMLSLSHQ